MDIKRPVFNFDNKQNNTDLKKVEQQKQPTKSAPNPVTTKSVNVNQPSYMTSNNVTIGSEEKVKAPKTYNPSNKKLWIIIISIVLAVALAITSVLIFGNKKPNIPTDIMINLEAKSESYDFSNLQTVNHNGTDIIQLFPGDTFEGNFGLISIGNEDPSKNGPVFVRFKLYGIVDNNYYGNIFSAQEITEVGEEAQWFTSVDGYIYYRNLLYTDEELDLSTTISLIQNSTNNYFQGKTVYMNCVFEVLQASAYQSIEEVWTGAPYLWRLEIVEKLLQA